MMEVMRQDDLICMYNQDECIIVDRMLTPSQLPAMILILQKIYEKQQGVDI